MGTNFASDNRAGSGIVERGTNILKSQLEIPCYAGCQLTLFGNTFKGEFERVSGVKIKFWENVFNLRVHVEFKIYTFKSLREEAPDFFFQVYNIPHRIIGW